jgi:hypothetical protein
LEEEAGWVFGPDGCAEKQTEFRGTGDGALPEPMSPTMFLGFAGFAISTPERDIVARGISAEVVRALETSGPEILNSEIRDSLVSFE